ncbi:MAG: sigma-54 dependent transcriptional regulator [Spirochaetia bacterium]|nr:sigma-54 dependent transcriptional regulator [Spirochaetia bacterium]MCF7940381.1 sigma-54 dependent transcriptional regulator [Spirochaetia bacterium]
MQILIVDDEKNIRNGLGKALSLEGYQIVLAEHGAEAWDLINSTEIDLVISDLKMPKLSGEELLKRISSSYPTLPVIILTGHGTIETAVHAMQDGAFDFVTKPINLDRLVLLVKRALSNRELHQKHEALKREVEMLKKQTEYSAIIGKSANMRKMMDAIKQVADTKASVLITGESGVGKELVADALHDLSSRADGPYVKVHCAALSESLLESELFGHEKGSFTGALSQKKGRFELADKGTIFLDEIGEINAQVQVKILRVLQEKTFERVGGETTIHVDTRIISATNRDLKEEIADGSFREDLFYRLNVVNIEVPSLRERKEDIPLLMTSFLHEFNEENGRSVEGFSPKAQSIMYRYSWPGNIRELRNCIESALVMCRGSVIDVDDLPLTVRSGVTDDQISIPLGVSLSEAEKDIIKATLAFCKGNKSKAAEVLGIGRKTLHRKIQEYQLEE